MCETSKSSRTHEDQAPLANDELIISNIKNESDDIVKDSINVLGNTSNFISPNEFKNPSRSTKSFAPLTSRAATLNASHLFQNSTNLYASRSLSSKLPLNTTHKISLGRSRHPNSSSTPGFPSKVPELKKKSTSAPPDEFKSLEMKIQLVKKRLKSLSVNEPEKEFNELENDILKDVNKVTKSIDKVLEERKEIQLQHKKWLEDRKKKIWETKKETKLIKDSSSNLLSCP